MGFCGGQAAYDYKYNTSMNCDLVEEKVMARNIDFSIPHIFLD